MVNSFELMSHFPMFNVIIPANTFFVFKAIFDLTEFDVAPKWMSDLLVFDPSDEAAFSFNFIQMGIDSTNIFLTMESLVFNFSASIFVTFLVSLLLCKNKV
jgi:hypothetical protein